MNIKALEQYISEDMKKTLINIIDRKDYVKYLYHSIFWEIGWEQTMTNKVFDRISDENVKEINARRKNLEINLFTENIWFDQEAIDLCEHYADKQFKRPIFNFVGDVHGDYDGLVTKLKSEGYYFDENNILKSDHNIAIFIGDYIDRGYQNIKVLELVKSMVEAKNALAILGNHDWNWLKFNTLNNEGKPLREHSIGNLKQNENTRNEWKDLSVEKQDELLNWLGDLPFYINHSEFMAGHAFISENIIIEVEKHAKSLWCSLTFNGLKEIIKKTPTIQQKILLDYIDIILTGFEASLPNGITFIDKGGKERDMARIKWWKLEEAKLLFDGIVNAETHNGSETFRQTDFPSKTKTSILKMVGTSEKQVFFGHFQVENESDLTSGNFNCLDFKKENISIKSLL